MTRWKTPAWRQGRWPMIVDRSVRDLFANDGLVWAAAVSFYALLSFFPLVIAVIIVASYVTDPASIAERIVTAVNEFVPAERIDPVALVEGARRERGRLGVVAVVVVLIVGRRVFGTLTLAMDRMSDVDQRNDSFRRRALIELLLVGGIAAVAALAIVTRPVLAVVERSLGIATSADATITLILLEVLQTFLIFAAFALVYAVVPLGERMWRAVLIASAVVTIIFLITRAAFTALVDLLWQSLSTLYGPLATAAFLLTWVTGWP